jgi:hypothetical protein
VRRVLSSRYGTAKSQAGDARVAISVVVVAFNMARELPRTLRSLSPRMQQGIAAADYEVIVVDNGSSEPFDRELCSSFGANVRFVDVDQPLPSPSRAVNIGLAETRGDLVGVLIDGARMASPGLLRHALSAGKLHNRPVIATLAFHLGSQVQMESVHLGYDAAEEDLLLDSVDWQEDGYRLFDISVFAGSSDRGWFTPPAESNALFLTRELWTGLGGYDEQFTSPGGGLVNLDTFARACELPGTQLVMLLGEATFHQVHGGVATNATHSPGAAFIAEYERLRGKPFERVQARPLFLGTASPHIMTSLAQSVSGERR